MEGIRRGCQEYYRAKASFNATVGPDPSLLESLLLKSVLKGRIYETLYYE